MTGATVPPVTQSAPPPPLLTCPWHGSVLLVLCAASLPLHNIARVATFGPERVNEANRARVASFQSASAQHEQGEKAEDWRTVVAARVRFMPACHKQWNLLPTGSFTRFLLGLIAYRLGLFDQPERHRRMIIAIMTAGAVSWALANWVFPIGSRPPAVIPPGTTPVDMASVIARANGFRLVRDLWLAFTCMGAILLLVAHSRAWIGLRQRDTAEPKLMVNCVDGPAHIDVSLQESLERGVRRNTAPRSAAGEARRSRVSL